LDAIDEELAIDEYGSYEESESQKTYRKKLADIDLDYATSVANALKTLQTDDAVSKKTYTTDVANDLHTRETESAKNQFTYHDSVADAEHTRAKAVAAANKSYLTADANARKARRTSLAGSSADEITSNADGFYAAYAQIHAHYGLPFTAYMQGLAQVHQSLGHQLALANTSLAANRNDADDLYYNAVITGSYDLDGADADAAKAAEKSTATAIRDSAVAHADAVKEFTIDLATPAMTYLKDLAAAQATYSIDLATAEKTYVHEQVDQLASADPNRSQAIGDATATWNTSRDAHRRTWWTAEANEQADLAIDRATADRDRIVASLTAVKQRIVDQNQAQRAFRTLESNAYHASETAWTEHEADFLMGKIAADAAFSSGLSDPWSVRDDALRSGRAASEGMRVTAARTRNTQLIDAQRTAELVLNNAEITLRNSQVQSTLHEYTNQADGERTRVTGIANSHRTAGKEGSLPPLTVPKTPVPGTLEIAQRISPTMPATEWLAVTNRVVERTDAWIDDFYEQFPEFPLELTETIPQAQTTLFEPFGAVDHLYFVGGLTDPGIPSRTSAPAMEGTTDAESGDPPSANEPTSVSDAFELLADALVTTIFGRGRPAVTAAVGVGAALLGTQVSATNNKGDKTWSEATVQQVIRQIDPNIAEWFRLRQAVILFVPVAGNEVQIHAVTRNGNALIIEIGKDLTSHQAAVKLYTKMGTVVSEFVRVIDATRSSGWFGLSSGWSPWEASQVGKGSQSPFQLTDDYRQAMAVAVKDTDGKLAIAGTSLTVVVMANPAGEMYGLVEDLHGLGTAVAQRNPRGAVIATGAVIVTVLGTFTVVDNLGDGVVKLKKADELSETARTVNVTNHAPVKGLRATIIAKADEILAPLKAAFPDTKVGFRGSLARGTKGSHKGGGPFDPNDYDVDAFVVSDTLATKVPKDAKGFRNLGRLPEHQGLIKSISDKFRALAGHRDQPVKIRVFSEAEFRALSPDEIHLIP
jgi:hypothetical protein